MTNINKSFSEYQQQHTQELELKEKSAGEGFTFY